MRSVDAAMLDEAIAWHLRTSEGDDEDWGDFVVWLEADPRHNAAYEAVVDAEGEFDGLRRLVETGGVGRGPVKRAAGGRFRPAGWRVPALAASLALALLGSWALSGWLHDDRVIVTAPGEVRTLTLADGTRVTVNGGTRLVLNGWNSRRAELKTGEAQFTVRLDPAHPFELRIGSQRIVDLGTVFDVFRNHRITRIEVAEGSVRFEDDETRLRLDAGNTLVSAGDRIVESSKPVSAIGSWTRGTLVYRDAPLVDIVGDLSRNRGIAIELGPELSDRTFTGVIQLGDSNDQLRARVAQLLRVRIVQTPDGWTLTR
jgi:transmembrane sensor